ncbi:class I SAM-dependent methyltransferase [Rhodopirellula sp. JC740]|uniref:Class I SAM-dependent methyltransferase n=2 Tax=Rhodopirellula halodulae TaxID=2894198 RepID=A0ABS8NJ07_9BACT|nr:class I SAM-dependent methyltransferase [Rhodopirellula sp. JC740]
MLLSGQRRANQTAPIQQVLTIGRQQLFLRPREVETLREEFDLEEEIGQSVPEFGGYCESFLISLLRCERVQSLDFSDYECASIIHDLNLPVPSDLHEAFDLIVDGGSLEHLFHVPQALENYIRMLKLGGRLVISTVANNHCGHGFYQFSPEFFYRVFAPENGFSDPQVMMVEHPFPGVELSSATRCYKVVDPDEVAQRVGLVNDRPVMLIFSATRSQLRSPFERPVQQSDYQRQWNSSGPSAESQMAPEPTGVIRRCKRVAGNSWRAVQAHLPEQWKQHLNGLRQRRLYSFRNNRFFCTWKP